MNTKSLFPRILLGGLAAFLIFPGSSRAALLYYEGFDYGSTAGNLTAVSSGAWTTSSADNDAAYLATGLTYGSLQTSGGAAQSTSTWGSGTRILYQDFADIDLSGKTEVWVSLLLEIPGSIASGSQATFGIRMKRNSWGGTNDYGAGKAWSNTTSYTSSFLGDIPGADFATVGGETILLVYRYAAGSAGELWLNPVLGGSAPTPGTGISLTDTTNTGLTAIESIYINYRSQVLTMDELRIGDTFADVTPVPEPAAATLLGLTLAALGLGRRKIRK